MSKANPTGAARRFYSRARLHGFAGARARSLMVVGLVVAAGAVLSIFNVPLASSAANAVLVAHIAQAVPVEDPQSPLWNQAAEAAVPLSSQQIYQPGGGTTREVRVRALEDGRTFGIMVSWDDDTRNDTTGQVPTDSAAVQLPIDPTHLPYQCMGQSTNRVNIWQWKAALEREGQTNLGALPLENPGTRNLTSNGICKAVDTPGSEPHAKSFHDGKQWHVVFSRQMGGGTEAAAPLALGTNGSIAFAVWNGARGEARGMKSVSTWNALQFVTPQQGNVGNLVTLGIVVAISAAIVAYAMRRFAA